MSESFSAKPLKYGDLRLGWLSKPSTFWRVAATIGWLKSCESYVTLYQGLCRLYLHNLPNLCPRSRFRKWIVNIEPILQWQKWIINGWIPFKIALLKSVFSWTGVSEYPPKRCGALKINSFICGLCIIVFRNHICFILTPVGIFIRNDWIWLE